MKNKLFPVKVLALLTLLCLMMISLPAAAQDKLDLHVSKLNLKPGESYTFEIEGYPENGAGSHFTMISSDESVAVVDPDLKQVRAAAPGGAVIFVESEDGFASATCKVTVSGAEQKDASKNLTGADLVRLSKNDRKKIVSIPLKSYLDFLDQAVFTADSAKTLKDRIFYVTAEVVPGTEKAESNRALSIGMLASDPLEELNMVTLLGTFDRIMSYIAGNSNLISVFGGNRFFEEELAPEDPGDLEAKGVNLQGNVEGLTKISQAHKLGYKGKGTVVAIVDTGLNKNHEQYGGRVIKEACFSNQGVTNKYSNYTIAPVCKDGGTSSAASLAKDKSHFNHGSHVAGIAAGKNGIAPEAKIISINVFTEIRYKNGNKEATCWDTDLVRAYNQLIKWSSKYNIAAANMSLGGGKYTSKCDNDSKRIYNATIFGKMLDAGIIPVVCSHNYGWAGAVTHPSCISTGVTVGRLEETDTPTISASSNHSKLVDILAPGTNLYSSYYVDNNGKVCTNCYGYMSGTSMATPVVSGALAILKQVYPKTSAKNLEKFYSLTSTKKVNYRSSGEAYNPDTGKWRWVNAKTFDYKKPSLDFTNFAKHVIKPVKITGKRGFDKGILLTVDRAKLANGYSISVYDMNAKQNASFKKKITHSGNTTTIKLTGLTNGHIYRIKLSRYHTIGNIKYKTKITTTYAEAFTPIKNLTATVGSQSVRANIKAAKNHKYVQFEIIDAATKQVVKKYNRLRTKLPGTITGLQNGKLYILRARPYNKWNGKTLFGSYTASNVMFVPLPRPTSPKVTFSGSNAIVSSTLGREFDGMKVLYRKAGGKLVNGCETSSSRCSIKGLNSKSKYEFYILGYKNVNGTRFYGPGALLRYKTSKSGLPSPTKLNIIRSASGKAIFQIKKDSKAKGICVLARVPSGSKPFKQICQAAGNKCSGTLNKSTKYTFYVMQFRIVNGKKVYSPGITARNWYRSKSADGTGAAEEFIISDEKINPQELYGVLEDFYTEEDLFMDEVNAVLNSGKGNEKAIELPEPEVMPEEDPMIFYFMEEN